MENTYNYLIEDKFHAMTTENQPQIAGWCSILPLIAGLRWFLFNRWLFFYFNRRFNRLSRFIQIFLILWLASPWQMTQMMIMEFHTDDADYADGTDLYLTADRF